MATRAGRQWPARVLTVSKPPPTDAQRCHPPLFSLTLLSDRSASRGARSSLHLFGSFARQLSEFDAVLAIVIKTATTKLAEGNVSVRPIIRRFSPPHSGSLSDGTRYLPLLPLPSVPSPHPLAECLPFALPQKSLKTGGLVD